MKLPPTVSVWVYAAVLAAGFAAGWTVCSWRTGARLAAEAGQREQHKVDQAREDARIGRQLSARAQEISDENQRHVAAVRRAAAGLHRDTERVREQIVAATACPAAAGTASGPDRTCGDLLADGLRVQVQLAAGAEAEAASVRDVLRAWREQSGLVNSAQDAAN